MKLSISTKVFLVVQTLCLFVVLGMGFAAHWSFRHGFLGFLNEQAIIRLESTLPAVERAYAEHGSWTFIKKDRVEWFKILGSTAFLTDEERPLGPGEPSTSDLTGAHMRFTLLDAQHRIVIGYTGFDRDRAALRPVRVNHQTVGWLAMTPFQNVSATGDRRFQTNQARSSLVIAGLCLLLSGLIAWRIARTLLRPVRQMAQATHQVATGDYGIRVKVHSKDEIGQLAQDFNRMAHALESNENMRRHFMADISHELRTPLAVLRGELEALEDGVRPLSLDAIRSLQSEVSALNKLVDDIFALSLAEVGAQAYRKEPVRLDIVLQSVTDTFQARCRQHDLTLTLDLPSEDLWITGDESRLQQLFSNLLENSCHYTNAGGRIVISVKLMPGNITISFADSSPGVPEEQLPRLFERFYRIEQSRNRVTGGAGLGLAICRGIVEAHGGTIQSSPSELGGLCVTLYFPQTPRMTE
ncbi:two-component system sensor histidine kinase BaeS [Pseudomonas duriflava]|uniref:histidine kinase n=1 Tax=Pseudomonas duriflava TaxID=459528 RepID=A0A562QA84_9PSED|nr:ATP-binding protein [Pseudomonas duriflava]TWI53675.1 two-component system sensor histidine kinase BaeS [Pseudomonas duriflava]